MGHNHKLFEGRWAWLKLLLLALVPLALIGLGGWVAGWQIWAQRHRSLAEQALARRDLTGALEHLKLCLRVWPTSSETHFLAARTARRAGLYDEAEEHLRLCKKYDGVPEAIELEQALVATQRGDWKYEQYLHGCVTADHPDAELILEALVFSYMKTYRLGHAIKCLDYWLEHFPDNVLARLWRGRARELTRFFAEALEDYHRAVELAPDHFEARERLAELLIHKHQAAEALPHFEYLRQRQPDNAAVLLGLARCRAELAEQEAARELLDQFLATHPDHPVALTERGKLALAMGQPAEAEPWLRRAAVASYDPETIYVLMRCLHQNGKAGEAKEWLARFQQVEADLKRVVKATRAITQRPNDPDLRCEVGTLMLRNGQEEEGLRWLNSALHEKPEHGPTLQALADYYGRHGRPDVAAGFRARARRAGLAP
jgi:tetratricopeptide (TPR) repeat protein